MFNTQVIIKIGMDCLVRHTQCKDYLSQTSMSIFSDYVLLFYNDNFVEDVDNLSEWEKCNIISQPLLKILYHSMLSLINVIIQSKINNTHQILSN